MTYIRCEPILEPDFVSMPLFVTLLFLYIPAQVMESCSVKVSLCRDYIQRNIANLFDK